MYPEKRTIKDVKNDIRKLTDRTWIVLTDKRVSSLLKQIEKENAPKVKALEEELNALIPKKREPKPRWPENTPKSVLDFCEKYWRGTTEMDSYRIHCWNDKAVWTSWPSGGYSTVGGWNPVSATFFMLSLKEKPDVGMKSLLELEGREGSQSRMQAELDKLA